MRKKHIKPKPSNSPHYIRSNPFAWWYEDKNGIDVIVRPESQVEIRLLWVNLLRAAKRCGRLP